MVDLEGWVVNHDQEGVISLVHNSGAKVDVCRPYGRVRGFDCNAYDKSGLSKGCFGSVEYAISAALQEEVT